MLARRVWHTISAGAGRPNERGQLDIGPNRSQGRPTGLHPVRTGSRRRFPARLDVQPDLLATAVPGAGRSKLPLSGYRLSRTRRLGSASRRLFHRATGRRRGRHHGVTGAGAGRHRGSFHGRHGGSAFLPGTTGTDGRSGAGGDHRLRSGRPADLQENRLGCPPNGFSPRFRPPFRCLVRSRHPEVGPPLGQDADAVHARRPRPGTGRRLQPLRPYPPPGRDPGANPGDRHSIG